MLITYEDKNITHSRIPNLLIKQHTSFLHVIININFCY